MTVKWQLKDHEAEQRMFNRRLMTASVLILLLFISLIAQLFDLQVTQHEYFSARSDGNRMHSQYVAPARGLIFDQQGELLADNQPIFNLIVVKEQVEDLDATLEYLGTLIRLTEEDIAQFNSRMQRNRVPFSSIPLRYVLSDEEKSRIAVNSHLLPGIAIEPQFVRQYPLGSLTAHAVGYVSEINREELDDLSEEDKENYGGTNHIGKNGVEKTYEDILHGTVGYEIVEKNNRGQVMRYLDRTDPVAGKNITLHMHAELQRAAEEILGDLRGAVVAIEPATGGILAMVSKPGFDPNLFVTGISSKDYSLLVTDEINTPLFDRTTNPYPPGSTIKPFIGLAGLHHEFIDYEYTIHDPGYFRLPGVSYRWGDWTLRTQIGGGHEHTNLQKAIFQSCNTFFFDLGHRMGIDTIHGFMSQFGFGGNFTLDVSYARTGVLPSRGWKMETRGEPWYPGDTINSSIGQGYMWATPLQLATAASIVANKGNVIQPRMLKAIEGQEYTFPQDQVLPDVLLANPDYWRYIEESMTMVVHRPYSNQFRDYGTAYPEIAAKDADMSYKLAGKSGTAQAVGISQDILSSDDIVVSDLNRDHALFIAFAPAMNPHIAPQIALAVFVENGESGGGAAGPIAKQLTDKYLLEILKIDFEDLENETPSVASETSMLFSESDE